MWTPLIVKTPHQHAGAIDDRPVRSIDVLPTIADVLDVKLPWKVDGRSILGRPRPNGPVRIFDWKYNVAQPPKGTKFLTFKGVDGFNAILHGGTASDPSDPALSLYRLGPYGGLVGQRAAPLVDNDAEGPGGGIAHPEHFENVDPDATLIPWGWVQGTVRSLEQEHPIAVAVNGVIAGISATVSRGPGSPRTAFWASLAPQMFVKGHNDIDVYLIDGTPAAPHLVKVAVS
jgi:hypothetical protein